jgi:hypothetical protein
MQGRMNPPLREQANDCATRGSVLADLIPSEQHSTETAHLLSLVSFVDSKDKC